MVKARAMIAHVVFGILLFLEGLSKKESCHRKVLYVDEITQHSAVLYWKNEREGDSKVVCAGVRQYVTRTGEQEVDLDTVTQFVARGIDRVFLSHLQPNFKYSCSVLAEEKTRPLLFATQYATPEPPETPAVVYGNDGKQIYIQLYPSSTKYGPIDGYEVQFHITDSTSPHSHGQLDLPEELARPGGLLASVQEAATSPHPVSFSLAFRNRTSLPDNITISSSLLRGAVRSGTMYYIISAAYTGSYNTQLQGSDKSLLYSLSPPSKTFSLIITSEELLVSPSTLVWVERHLIQWSMVVGVACSNIILLYFLLVGCCVARLAKRKRGWLNNTPVANLDDERLYTDLKEEELPTATATVMCPESPTPSVCDDAGSFKEPSLRGVEETPVPSNERVCGPEMISDCRVKGSLAGEGPATVDDDDDDDDVEEGELPPQDISSPSLPGPHYNRDHCRDEDPGAERGMSGCEDPERQRDVCEGTDQEVEVSSVEVSGSSLVFVPRGLSRGSLSQSTSAGADMAPDLEMDLYGISYSLDEPQDN